MENSNEIEIKYIDWCDTVRGYVDLINDDIPADFLKSEVEKGAVKIVGVFNKTELVACWFFRLQIGAVGREMCLFGAGGRLNGFDLTAYALPKIITMAEKIGCKSIYFLTSRNGLIEKSKNHGFSYCETIMRKDLN